MDNLFAQASRCLSETELDKKITLTKVVAEKIINNELLLEPNNKNIKVGKPTKPELIPPRQLPRRTLSTLEGRAALIHSFAHIEFNAVNLAWDLICRFQVMPRAFYCDWAQVASEEASHFSLLSERLQQLDYRYGDFPAHDGLWKMAEQTAHDILLRLAVVPRILEARGLDVTPDIINRFQEINDQETVAVLKIIYRDEIGHVKIGTDWFRYVCEQRNLNPEHTFQDIFNNYAPKGKNKINRNARIKAGFSETELDTIL